jgi:EpsI family protein
MTIRTRAVLLAVLFVASWAALGARARTDAAPARVPLLGLPMTIDDWKGRPSAPLDARVLAALGADDHLLRVYSNGAGQQAGLYIGFHASQRQGSSIHSPMNCLPGAGWQPISHGRLAIPDQRDAAPGATAEVNHVIIQKGDARQVVLYWYQSQGRVVASEYSAKAYLFLDAARAGRSDASLVRIVTPIGDGSGGEARARDAAVSFATSLLPRLAPYLPE